jgi:hypothetical protein
MFPGPFGRWTEFSDTFTLLYSITKVLKCPDDHHCNGSPAGSRQLMNTPHGSNRCTAPTAPRAFRFSLLRNWYKTLSLDFHTESLEGFNGEGNLRQGKPRPGA